jgi:arylsulfatase A-like enzyme
MEGVSLLPLLRRDRSSWRTSFLIESYGDDESSPSRHPVYQAFRTVRWKYIKPAEAGSVEELYDLHADWYEMINLAGRESAKFELRRMRATLAKLNKASK